MIVVIPLPSRSKFGTGSSKGDKVSIEKSSPLPPSKGDGLSVIQSFCCVSIVVDLIIFNTETIYKFLLLPAVFFDIKKLQQIIKPQAKGSSKNLQKLWFELKDGFTILTKAIAYEHGMLWFELKDGFTILRFFHLLQT